MKKRISAACVMLVVPWLASAQVKVGTAGANFLQIGVSPRAVGMGEAFVAVANDVAASFYNPAGLSLLQKRQAMVSHIDWPAGIQCEHAALAMPMWGGTVALSATLLHMDDMEVTTPFYPNGTGQFFSVRNVATGASYSRFLTDKFSFGLTAKFVQLFAHDVDAQGWSADVGTFYNTGFQTLRIAMAITNFGPDLTFIREKFPLPINFSLGFAVDPLRGPDHRLTLAFTGSHPSDNQERYTLGTEYWYRDVLALRAGYKMRYDAEDLSFGASVGTSGVSVDYAYVPSTKLEDSHRFSVSVSF